MDPLRKIYRDMKNKLRASLPSIAYEIGDKMFKKYVDCVEAFYGHMDEGGYLRTYSTYLGDQISYSYGEKTSGSVRNKGGETTTFSIYVEMQVDPSNLGDPYKDPVDYVFERTWGQGIHGNLANPQMPESPRTTFEKWFEVFRVGDVKMITNRKMISLGFVGS